MRAARIRFFVLFNSPLCFAFHSIKLGIMRRSENKKPTKRTGLVG